MDNRQIGNWQDELFACKKNERNARIPNSKIGSETELLNEVLFAVGSRISSCRKVKNTIQNNILYCLCRISFFVLETHYFAAIILVLLVSLLFLSKVESSLFTNLRVV